MGELAIRILQVHRVGGQLTAKIGKKHKHIELRFVVVHANAPSETTTATSVPTSGPLEVPSAPQKVVALTAVRFSSRIVVEVRVSGSNKSLGFATIAAENCVRGVPRRVRLTLHPLEEVDDDVFATVLCDVSVEITAADFGDDPASVDHVRRAEEEQPFTERLRRFLIAYEPAALRELDVRVVEARRAGWDATFQRLLRSGPEPMLRTVRVAVLHGNDFPREDGGNAYIDPYVKVSTRKVGFGDQLTTAVISSQQNPVWNDEVAEFRLLHGEKDELVFSVWDRDLISADDFVGEACVPLGLLVNRQPTKRRLFVMNQNGSVQGSLTVELTALDFGLDAATHGPLVDDILAHELPRLEAFYQRRTPAALGHIEADLIAHSLVPGGFEAWMVGLVAKHGLEPGKDIVTVTVESLQDVVDPKRRRALDFSKQRIRLVVVGTASLTPSADATGSRARFKDRNVAEAHVAFPERDVIAVGVYACDQAKSDTSDNYSLLGEVEIPVAKLMLNTPHRQTYRLVNAAKTTEAWLNGSITVSLSSKHVGNPSVTVVDAEEDGMRAQRLCGLLARYKPKEVHRAYYMVATGSHIDGYIDSLVHDCGPPPGTYTASLKIISCTGLPRLETLGAGLDPYVTITTREHQFATKVVHSLTPEYHESFELDLLDPKKEVITLRVMDYDANSDDDPVSTVSFPAALLATLAQRGGNHTFHLCPVSERFEKKNSMLPATEGTIVIAASAVKGFDVSPHMALSAAADAARSRIIALLHRYKPSLLGTYETLLWSAASCEDAVKSVVLAYGRERGTGLLHIAVEGVESVLENKYDLQPSNCRLGVQVVDPMTDNVYNKMVSTPSGQMTRAQHNVTASGTLDLRWPETDVVCLTVYDAQSMKVFGSVHIPAARMSASAPRSFRCPIIANVGYSTAFVSGWARISLRSDMELQRNVCLTDDELQLRERVIAMYGRYLPHKLHEADSVMFSSPVPLATTLEQLVATYGVEPGTHILHLTVIGCKNLPRIELCGGDPYAIIECEGMKYQAPFIRSTVEPTWNTVIDLDLKKPSTAEITFTIMDHDDASADDEWCKVVVPVKSFCKEQIERWLPVAPCGRTIGVKETMGCLGLRGHTVGFGYESLDALRREDEGHFRERMIKLLRRYTSDCASLAQYEVLLWSGPTLAVSLESAVRRYGNEEGTGRMQITIHSIEKLQVAEGKIAKKGRPYVELKPNISATIPSTMQKTKSSKSVGPNHPNLSDAFVVDIPRPHLVTNSVTLRVMDDVLGEDHEFGTVLVTFYKVQPGAPRRRTLPIGNASGYVSGYITISVESLQAQYPVMAVDEEVDTAMAKRVATMYKFYCPSNIPKIDTVMDYEQELDMLVRKFGAEPGTYKVLLTIHSCADLPAVEMIGGCDPYVLVECSGRTERTNYKKSTLTPSFEEAIEVIVSKPEKDEIKLTVMDYDAADEDDLVADVIVPLSSLCVGEAVTRVLPLSSKVEGKPSGGFIKLTARSVGFGPAQLPYTLQQEEEYRNRIVSVLRQYTKAVPTDYEKQMWSAPSFDAALAKVVQRYGAEPGSRELTLLIHSVHDLERTDVKGIVTSGSIYVEVLAPLVQDAGTFTTKKAQRAASGPGVAWSIEESFRFEVRAPERDSITLCVMNDVIGSDYEFGRVSVGLQLLRRGEPKRRTLPLYKVDPKSPDVIKATGFVTFSITSTKFGRSADWSVEDEKQRIDILRGLYLRYNLNGVGDVDALVNQRWNDFDSFLGAQVQKYGPLPGTYSMAVTILSPPQLLTPPLKNNQSMKISVQQNSGAWEMHNDGRQIDVDVQHPTESYVQLHVTSGDTTVGYCAFQSRLAVPDGCTDVVRSLHVIGVAEGTKVASVIGTLRVSICSTTCGVHRRNPNDAAAVDVEDNYRRRMIAYFTSRAPNELSFVDSHCLGQTAAQMDECFAALAVQFGAEDGAMTLRVRLVSISDVDPSLSPASLYTKIYVNGVPVVKQFVSDGAVLQFTKPMNIAFLAIDMLGVKLGVKNRFSTKAVGRSTMPLRWIPYSNAAPSATQRPSDAAPDEVLYDMTFVCYDDSAASSPYVGRVTLSFLVKGFPSASRVMRQCTEWHTALIAKLWQVHRSVTSSKDSRLEGFHSAAVERALGYQAQDSKYQQIAQTVALHGALKLALQDHDYNDTLPRNAAILCIHVVGCRGIPQMDTFGTSDTFVELVSLGAENVRVPVRQSTRVVSGTLNPNFYFYSDDVLLVYISNPTSAAKAASEARFTLSAYDEDVGGRELIGSHCLSQSLLLSGRWDVSLEELESIDRSSAAAWIASNEHRMLRLPLILPQQGSTTGQSRGELLLLTSLWPLLPKERPESKSRVVQPIVEWLKRASQSYTRNKLWAQAEQLHAELGMFLGPADDAVAAAKCQQRLSELTKEFGTS